MSWLLGTVTNAYRGANLHPDFQSSSWYISDMNDFSTRPKDPCNVSEEDKETILETLKYWEGKSMEDLAGIVMPKNIQELEKDDIICVGLKTVFPERPPATTRRFSPSASRDMEECQRNIDNTLPQTMEEQAKVDFWQACIIQCEPHCLCS